MIPAGAIYIKTRTGMEEVRSRKMKLPSKLRTLLILIDGTKPAVNALGLKAFFFTLKLEKCATVDDLRGLLVPYREAITKGSGEAEAEVLGRRLLELLG